MTKPVACLYHIEYTLNGKQKEIGPSCWDEVESYKYTKNKVDRIIKRAREVGGKNFKVKITAIYEEPFEEWEEK